MCLYVCIAVSYLRGCFLLMSLAIAEMYHRGESWLMSAWAFSTRRDDDRYLDGVRWQRNCRFRPCLIV